VTLNLTMLRTGVTRDNGVTFAYNVIPQEATAGFDIRIPPHIDLKEFEQRLQSWLEPGVEFEFVVKSEVNNQTSTDEAKNHYWRTFKAACADAGVALDPQVFPAATDGRYLRNVAGLPVIGFSPIVHQPILLHENDERLNKYTFVRGIEVFENIVSRLTAADAGVAASE
jgi:aminoacylase